MPSADEVAEDVRGGGAGGCPLSPRMSLSEDWTSLAWLVLLQLDSEEVVDSDRWLGVVPNCPGFRLDSNLDPATLGCLR